MSYNRSAALALESPDYVYETPSRRERLSVVTGGGLDAQARKGVSASFVHTLQVVLLAVFVFFALGGLRVAITAQTVTMLRENVEIQNAIDTTSDANDSLRAERSSLSSSERIVAIATGNYGMHLAAANERLVLPESAEADAELATDTPVEASVESEDAPMTLVMASMD